MINLPTTQIPAAARPAPSTAARAPDAQNARNDIKPVQEHEGQFKDELTREIAALKGQAAATADAHDSAASAKQRKSEKSGEDALTSTSGTADASLAAMLSSVSTVPAAIIDVKALPAASEAVVTDALPLVAEAVTGTAGPAGATVLNGAVALTGTAALTAATALAGATAVTGATALTGAVVPTRATALDGAVALTEPAAATGTVAEVMPDMGNSRASRQAWLLQESTHHDLAASKPTYLDLSPDGPERAPERSSMEFLLTAKTGPAESAAGGQFLPEGRDALGSAAALEATLAQRHAADAALPSGANTAAATQGQVVHLAPSVATATATATATIATHLAAAGWDRGLGEKVVWMAGQKLQVAELHLNPPELGPLKITLTVNNDQASAQFVSQHATVREAIEAAMPRLREMLAEGGLTLGNTSVSAESFQQQSQQDSRNNLSRGAAQSDTGGAFALTQMLRTTRGLVDIFA